MCLLFFIEVMIALFVHDHFIRPYVGDYLVVILVYSFVRTFFKVSVFKAALGVFIFACTVEMLQYVNFIQILNLQHSKISTVVLGNSFEWIDIIAYALGTASVILFEKRNFSLNKNS
jgi:DNA integrity scanning protein DisA with diadenylate cyclase activity